MYTHYHKKTNTSGDDVVYVCLGQVLLAIEGQHGE